MQFYSLSPLTDSFAIGSWENQCHLLTSAIFKSFTSVTTSSFAEQCSTRYMLTYSFLPGALLYFQPTLLIIEKLGHMTDFFCQASWSRVPLPFIHAFRHFTCIKFLNQLRYALSRLYFLLAKNILFCKLPFFCYRAYVGSTEMFAIAKNNDRNLYVRP